MLRLMIPGLLEPRGGRSREIGREPSTSSKSARYGTGCSQIYGPVGVPFCSSHPAVLISLARGPRHGKLERARSAPPVSDRGRYLVDVLG
eukprot:554625-Pyramimonas_sp.AAC.1